MTALPINARVAVAIGWTSVQSIGVRGGVEKWVGEPPDNGHMAECAVWSGPGIGADMSKPCTCGERRYEPIPDYEHDWSAGGPLIGRFKVRTTYFQAGDEGYVAVAPPSNPAHVFTSQQRPGEADILPAICRVVLALRERAEEGR